jgi:1-acyl-sn-glycerol-3-phosphate acyltransferase
MGPEFARQVREIADRHPKKPAALTLYGSGLFEFLVIRHFLRKEFGESWIPRIGTRIYDIFFTDFAGLLRHFFSFFGLTKKPKPRILVCVEELSAGRPIMLNFETRDRRQPFETPLGERELTYLLNEHPDLYLIPVTFVWQRSSRRGAFDPQRDFPLGLPRWIASPIIYTWNIFLGDPYSPNVFRKLALLALGYGRSFVRASPEVTKDLPTNTSADSLESIVKSLRRRSLMSIQQEKRVVLGPTFRSTRFIAETLFRNTDFLGFIRRLSVEEGQPERTLLRRAQKIFKEMAVNYSYSVIEFGAIVLTWVFSTIYDGIRTKNEDFEALRAASKSGALVFVPSHKSYVDFLVLSFVLNKNDISPPHVIAGINLSFWPFGAFFRRSGAIFIRRSFRGNKLYQEVLRRYIATLLNSHINFEFFIEGMRSRNGKLAPPKYGILKNIVESYLRGEIRDRVQVVPVSISYDRVTEDRLHRRELEGGEKVNESFVGAVKALRVLFKNFGSVHLNFSPAIPLDQWISATPTNANRDGIEDSKVRLEVQKLAFEICHRINRATPITSVGLVAAALLAKPEASMTRIELDFWLDIMKRDLQRMRIPFAEDLEADFVRACRRGLARLIEDGVIEKFYTGGEDHQVGLKIPEKYRVAGLYYKNSVIHAFLAPAVMGLAINKAGTVDDEELLELRSFLEFEFFFPKKSEFLQEVHSLGDLENNRYYAYLLDDVLENIQLGLMALKEMPSLIIQSKDWRARIMKRAKGFKEQRIVIRSESVNTQSFGAFLEMAKNRSWLVATKADGDLFRVGDLSEIDRSLSRVQYYRSKLLSWEKNKVTHVKDSQPTV